MQSRTRARAERASLLPGVISRHPRVHCSYTSFAAKSPGERGEIQNYQIGDGLLGIGMVRGIDLAGRRMVYETFGGGILLRPRNVGDALLLTWGFGTAGNEEKKQA